MRTIEVYKTHDGQLFECEKTAKAHADDLLGEELDGLLKLANIDISRNTEYKALMQWLKDREKLRAAIAVINSLLQYEADNENDN